MFRQFVIVLCIGFFCLGLGCGGTTTSKDNPNNLPYSTEGPPKRTEGAGGGPMNAPKK